MVRVYAALLLDEAAASAQIRTQRGRSSEVERQLPKLNVVGSIPIARSRPLICRSGERMTWRAAMTSASADKSPQSMDEDGGNRLAINIAIAGIVLLIVAGILGWIAMGPSLFHLMATGIGWLCM